MLSKTRATTDRSKLVGLSSSRLLPGGDGMKAALATWQSLPPARRPQPTSQEGYRSPAHSSKVPLRLTSGVVGSTAYHYTLSLFLNRLRVRLPPHKTSCTFDNLRYVAPLPFVLQCSLCESQSHVGPWVIPATCVLGDDQVAYVVASAWSVGSRDLFYTVQRELYPYAFWP